MSTDNICHTHKFTHMHTQRLLNTKACFSFSCVLMWSVFLLTSIYFSGPDRDGQTSTEHVWTKIMTLTTDC